MTEDREEDYWLFGQEAAEEESKEEDSSFLPKEDTPEKDEPEEGESRKRSREDFVRHYFNASDSPQVDRSYVKQFSSSPLSKYLPSSESIKSRFASLIIVVDLIVALLSVIVISGVIPGMYAANQTSKQLVATMEQATSSNPDFEKSLLDAGFNYQEVEQQANEQLMVVALLSFGLPLLYLFVRLGYIFYRRRKVFKVTSHVRPGAKYFH